MTEMAELFRQFPVFPLNLKATPEEQKEVRECEAERPGDEGWEHLSESTLAKV
jgi:hypothetical protein